jgi:hypothetical protein
MAIRLRVVEGHWVALCAARSVEKEGDIYLDDGWHQALGNKFARDYHEMYGFDISGRDTNTEWVEREESNNSNREWWNSFYGKEIP